MSASTLVDPEGEVSVTRRSPRRACGALSTTCTRSTARFAETPTDDETPAGVLSGMVVFTLAERAKLRSGARSVNVCASATAAPASIAPKPY